MESARSIERGSDQEQNAVHGQHPCDCTFLSGSTRRMGQYGEYSCTSVLQMGGEREATSGRDLRWTEKRKISGEEEAQGSLEDPYGYGGSKSSACEPVALRLT